MCSWSSLLLFSKIHLAYINLKVVLLRLVCFASVQMVRRAVVIQQLHTLQKRRGNLQQLIATRGRSRPQSLRAKLLAKAAAGLCFRQKKTLGFSFYYVELGS